MQSLSTMSCCNRYSILCVDDEAEFLSYLVSILKQHFSNVYSAKNVQEAHDIIDLNTIDIIITDLCMPKINGLDFIKQIRSKRSMVSVIFLTACSEKERLHEAIPLGLDAYLLKPINLEKLFETLRRTIELIEGRSSKVYVLDGGCSFDLFDEVVFQTSSRDAIYLTRKELALLSLLVRNRQQITSKTVIEEYVWELQEVSESAVKTLIKKLRDKIGSNAIITHGSAGYSVSYKK